MGIVRAVWKCIEHESESIVKNTLETDLGEAAAQNHFLVVPTRKMTANQFVIF